jgi:BirA family biotin operon repressor/biotin-[acetyl-CoA-carboxylase] ligase
MSKKLNANFVKAVNILNDGRHHDGTQMGEQLQMTRSAVWKVIKKLQDYGVKVEAVKGKGYILLEPLVLLDKNNIKKKLPNVKLDLQIFESLSSTNDYLKINEGTESIQFCLAEQQTQGKGRLGREWYSPFAKNIYLSCRYPFTKDISELSGLSLVTCLAIVHALRAYGVNDKIYAKWPNDIVYAQQKLAGMLVEIQAESHGISCAVVGVGINVNMLHDNHVITQPWISLQKILGNYINRNELCAHLISSLLDYLNRFNKVGLAPFLKEWQNNDCLTEQTITVKTLAQTIKGKALGINTQGHLLLQLPDGATRPFSSGDTSIVKPDDYP